MPDPPLCVQCHKQPVDPSWRPFCSARCKTIDLGRWLSGDYRIPGGPAVSDRVDDEDPEPVDRRGH